MKKLVLVLVAIIVANTAGAATMIETEKPANSEVAASYEPRMASDWREEKKIQSLKSHQHGLALAA